MSRRKYPAGYTEAITGVVWLVLGIPMLLIATIKWLSGSKK